MQPGAVHHPERKRLEAFGLGRLSDADSMEIELHLTDCPACRQQVEEAPADALIGLLQTPACTTQDGYLGSASTTDDTSVRKEVWFGLRNGLLGSASPNDASSPGKESGPPIVTIPGELAGHPRYLVLGPLGSGGMGTLYKARHRLMDRVVALKIVNPLLVDKPGAVERFTREVRAAAQLVHPNIVTAYDAEKVGELLLLVMECVPGQTLAQVLAVEQHLPVARACEYLRQTALGLQHALDHGMVHRDIKPQNLMLMASPEASSSGVVKILDFGLARFVSELPKSDGSTFSVQESTKSDGSTEVGTIMGSPDYMAPEQAGNAHAADTRADIYGMGCTLYHLLAGQVPFPATSVLAKLEAHRDSPPISLCQLRPEVPVELAWVVEKMMAKSPAQRYQSPAEVVEALRPFTQATGSRPPPRTGRGPLIAFVLATGLLVAALVLWAAQVVFRVETPEGMLIVKTDDPDVQVSVKSAGKDVVLFFPRDKKEIPLKVGEYTLELVGGKEGLKLSTNKFEIKRGKDQKTVTVEFVPTVVTGSADRRSAEYVLSIGGKVKVNNQEGEISAAPGLPREPFWLTSVILTGNKQVGDANLAQFKECKNLRELMLGGTRVTDAGLAHFKGCTNLTLLALDETQVSDKGLSFFKDCQNLTYLHLDKTEVSDAGLAHFKDRKNLGTLVLSRTRVTDAGLAHFKDCKNLYWLWLNDTDVSDAGLAHFKDCKNLVYLILSRTKMSNAGLAHFKDCKYLRQLRLEGTRVDDAGLTPFKDCKDLDQLHLAGTQVSDAGLILFKECKQMTEVTVSQTKVTAAGITEMRKALPQCKIH